MAEGGALLRRYTGKTRIEGSNPSLSARSVRQTDARLLDTGVSMKTIARICLCLAVLAAAGCSLPEGKSGARVCIPDSGFCHFPD